MFAIREVLFLSPLTGLHKPKDVQISVGLAELHLELLAVQTMLRSRP